MTSTNADRQFSPQVGDFVFDARKERTGVIATRPVPGRWIWLHAPGRPRDEWATLFGDLRPAGNETQPAESAG